MEKPYSGNLSLWSDARKTTPFHVRRLNVYSAICQTNYYVAIFSRKIFPQSEKPDRNRDGHLEGKLVEIWAYHLPILAAVGACAVQRAADVFQQPCVCERLTLWWGHYMVVLAHTCICLCLRHLILVLDSLDLLEFSAFPAHGDDSALEPGPENIRPVLICSSPPSMRINPPFAFGAQNTEA